MPLTTNPSPKIPACVDDTTSRLTGTDWLLLAVLALVTFGLYYRTQGFDFIGYDDFALLKGDWHVRGGLTWQNIRWAMTAEHFGNWYPVTLLVDMALTSLFGGGPRSFHVFNAVFHSINVALLYVFLCRTTGLRMPAFIVAALWGWHPLHVESVAWASELKDVLCVSFGLLCLLAYVKYRRGPSVGKYLIVVIFLALALMTKSMAVTIPAVLLLLDYWPLRRGTSQDVSRTVTHPVQWWVARIGEKIPLILLSLGACLIAMHTQRIGGSMASPRIFTWHLRWTNALVSFVIYIGKTFWPTHLGLIYPHPAMIDAMVPAVQWMVAASVLLLVTAIVVWQRNARPYLVTGWLWYVGTLIPVIGLVQVGEQARANRYTYLPSIGLLIAIVWLVWGLVASRRVLKCVFVTAICAACAALAVVTVIQVGYWRDTVTLFTHSNAVIPDNYLAQTLLSNWQRQAGHNDEALVLARSAVRICNLSEGAHTSLALALENAGQLKESLHEFIAAIKLNPKKASIRNDVGGLLVSMHSNEQALLQFGKAIEIDPYLADARHNMAMLLAAKGQFGVAIAQWKRAVQLEPKNGIYHGWLGDALRLNGNRREAAEQYRAAYDAGERKPAWETNLAWLVATDPQSTAEDAQQVVAIAQDACDQTGKIQALSLDALAAALARAGRFDDAVAQAKLAVRQAKAAGQPKLAAAIDARLAGYQLGRPFIDRP